MRNTLAALAALTLGAGAHAQAISPFGSSHDPAIPTLEAVLGHDFGAEITPPEDAIRYLRALAAAAPERMTVTPYAQSWEGRELAYAVIAKPETIARLDEVKADLARLADPRGVSAAQRRRIVAETPAVVWLSYGVHGDEISSTDAALLTAYHLLAARGDEVVDTIRNETIVVIDPTQNPDGRARFIHSFEAARGLEPQADRFAAEHDQPWPGGRGNHYLFDMNRDWFALTQPESRGRVAAMQEWWPVVVVDAHEMGGDSTYFFPPSAEPFNPQIVDSQKAAQGLIGRNHAAWFDRFGFDYYTREIFDAFYPGYGDMWPTLHGAVALTYEQASARGLVWRRPDGSQLTYADGVERHFVASVSTAQAVAENRETFLADFADFRLSAVTDTTAPRAYLLDRSANRWGAERLARNLAEQGIEVGRVDGAVNACGAEFPGGAFLVRTDQPAGRLARTLLDPDTPLPDDFTAEQERRRAKDLGHEIYDVTAWSLPAMFDVAATTCDRTPRLEAEPVVAGAPIPGRVDGDDATFGYAIPWTDAGQAKLAAALLADGVALRATDEAFRIGGRVFPRGTAVAARAKFDGDLDAVVAARVSEIGGVATGLASSWVDDGPNLGSDTFADLRFPAIALAWGEGTSSSSVGATRYVLEQRYGLPVTPIRVDALGRADLSRLDVLILPDLGGGLSDRLGERGKTALQAFADGGGVVIGLGSATRYLASSDVGLIPAKRERAADGDDANDESDGDLVDGVVLEDEAAFNEAIGPSGGTPDSVPGVLARVVGDPDVWLSAGYDDGASALVAGGDIYAVVPRSQAATALRFAGPEDLLTSGYLWDENRRQLAFKPFLLAAGRGDGMVIAFTQSPTTRAYLEGLDLALLNAVLLAPAKSEGLR